MGVVAIPAEATPAVPGGSGHVRTRRCIVTGAVLPEARLLRFVADPEGRVVPDVAAKLPGRGLWVTSEAGAVRRAVQKNLFSRAAKARLGADSGLPELAGERLAARLLEVLGLARRSGAAILGFDSVERALRGKTPPAVVVEAVEASAEGARKLQAAAVAAGHVPFVISCFAGAELSLALGRANVVHAALKPGRMAERLIFDAGRLSGFRPLKPWIWTGFSDLPRGRTPAGQIGH